MEQHNITADSRRSQETDHNRVSESASEQYMRPLAARVEYRVAIGQERCAGGEPSLTGPLAQPHCANGFVYANHTSTPLSVPPLQTTDKTTNLPTTLQVKH